MTPSEPRVGTWPGLMLDRRCSWQKRHLPGRKRRYEKALIQCVNASSRTASLFPRGDSQNLILAALPRQEAFTSLFYPELSKPESEWSLWLTIYLFMHPFWYISGTKAVHFLCSRLYLDKCSESHFALSLCSWVQEHLFWRSHAAPTTIYFKRKLPTF